MYNCNKKLIGTIIVAILAVVVLICSLTIVPAGCTGVVTTFGKVSESGLSEGIHFKAPFAQRVHDISNQIQVYETEADAVSKDLQSLNTKVAVNFRVQSNYSASIYKNVGENYQTVLLMPAVQESLKAVSAKYTAEQLITLRAQVGDEIKSELDTRLEYYGIYIEKFNIVNFDFSSEFNNAIEAKQVAEQNLIKTKTEQEQAIVVAEAEAKKKTISAEAEATAIKTKAAAQAKANKTLTASISKDLINYQLIEKWDGILPKVSGSSNPLVTMDLSDASQNTETKK